MSSMKVTVGHCDVPPYRHATCPKAARSMPVYGLCIIQPNFMYVACIKETLALPCSQRMFPAHIRGQYGQQPRSLWDHVPALT